MTARQPVIGIDSLEKTIGGEVVLDGLDLSVDSGETLVVLGRSGAGKSVLLKHIIGLMLPDRGRVRLFGEPLPENPDRRPDFRKRMGILFQGGALFDSMNVEDNISFPLRENTDRSPREIRREVRRRLEWVKLPPEVLEKFPAELSGGMQKRVALARAIIHDPEVILYDEPTAGLDPVTSDAINQRIVELQQRLRTTAVAVTHDLNTARRIGTRLALLHRGRIQSQVSVEEMDHIGDPYLRQFLSGQQKGPLTDEGEV